ncbi:MAG: CPBP family intramembrane metalloprotease [Bacteroidia bacterium]|nr:CPBP family intramembrane metalloprotease [Bacteroidia bacterium]
MKNSYRFNQPFGVSLALGMVFLVAGMVVGSILLSAMLAAAGVRILDPGFLNQLIESGDLGKMHILRWGQGISTLLTFALAGFLWARFESTQPLEVLKLKSSPYSPKQLWLAVLVIIASIPLVESIQFDAETFSLPTGWKLLEESIESMEETNFKTVSALLSDISFLGIFSNIMVIGLLAALGEEIFFRGFLQQTLARKMNPHVAVWLTGFIFSVIHFQFLGFFSRFLLGVVMGYLFLYSGSLWTSILAHFVNNALNVIVAAMIIAGWFGDVELDQSVGFPLWLSLISLAITGVLFFLFLRLGLKSAPADNSSAIDPSAVFEENRI